MQLLFQQVRVETKPDKKKAGQKRLAEAMFDHEEQQSSRERPRDEIELEGEYTASAREVLRSKDFEQMSAEEERQAREAILRMRMNRIEVKMRPVQVRIARQGRSARHASQVHAHRGRHEPAEAQGAPDARAAAGRAAGHFRVDGKLLAGVPAFPARADQ
jgi:uncharacterized protein with von Willebrand factor type A (vWA) domain